MRIKAVPSRRGGTSAEQEPVSVLTQSEAVPFIELDLSRPSSPARDPCLVLAPAFELKGTAHLMKATNRWEILVPPTSPDYLKVLPAPCIFHGATVEHEALQDAWARGRCSSMGEAWTIDSEIIRSQSRSLLQLRPD